MNFQGRASVQRQMSDEQFPRPRARAAAGRLRASAPRNRRGDAEVGFLKKGCGDGLCGDLL